MAVQFISTWDNTKVFASANAVSQQVVYRRKSIGGAFISVGFTPANPLPKSAITSTSPSLLDNVIYEFKQQTICTVNGLTDNDNGIREAINMVCILPTLTTGVTTASVSINVTSTDITKAKFTLRTTVGNTLVGSPITVNRVGNSIGANMIGLTAETGYYWQINLYSVVNGIEIAAPICTPYSITTEEAP